MKSAAKTSGITAVFLVILCAFFPSCADIQKPKIEPYVGQVKAPQKKQEFRWSNGKLPRQLDPALAGAPPETDLVRAVYEGLTDIDAKTLETKPAVAESWDVSDDGRTWTFHLRKDAKWTNGEPVTARDFARSWRRLAEMGMDVPNSKLLGNIVGAENFSIDDGISVLPPEEFEDEPAPEKNQNSNATSGRPLSGAGVDSNSAATESNPAKPAVSRPPEKTEKAESTLKTREKKTSVQKWLGVEAVDDLTLRVWLIQPDRNFAAVAANPIFCPVYQNQDDKTVTDLDAIERAPRAITNGAFKITSVNKDEVALSRSDSFWARDQIGLESVRMIAKPDAESALTAYQANELDAVTNASFEPLALKLLQPYQDFRRTTHNALTFYQFNINHAPFGDVRVRRALSMAIEREAFIQSEMDGAAQPALDFLPFVDNRRDAIKENVVEAKQLLIDAGYADGAAFPKFRLVVNRNDLQRRIANSIKDMWKKNLGIEIVITVLDRAEYEDAIKTGNYDLIRRGVVLPTVSETNSLLAMLNLGGSDEDLFLNKFKAGPGELKRPDERSQNDAQEKPDAAGNDTNTAREKAPTPSTKVPGPSGRLEPNPDVNTDDLPASRSLILTEDSAIELLPAIPLYFPVSNSLVKPYISGFDTNLLDAPSLKTIVIDANWKSSQPQK
jgi:oligopeptide transport system substrate-binding protein